MLQIYVCLVLQLLKENATISRTQIDAQFIISQKNCIFALHTEKGKNLRK
jgi:hypothetical protein